MITVVTVNGIIKQDISTVPLKEDKVVEPKVDDKPKAEEKPKQPRRLETKKE